MFKGDHVGDPITGLNQVDDGLHPAFVCVWGGAGGEWWWWQREGGQTSAHFDMRGVHCTPRIAAARMLQAGGQGEEREGGGGGSSAFIPTITVNRGDGERCVCALR
jgi:hypothetical protein